MARNIDTESVKAAIDSLAAAAKEATGAIASAAKDATFAIADAAKVAREVLTARESVARESVARESVARESVAREHVCLHEDRWEDVKKDIKDVKGIVIQLRDVNMKEIHDKLFVGSGDSPSLVTRVDRTEQVIKGLIWLVGAIVTSMIGQFGYFIFRLIEGK
jgi:hypothetical protein